MHSDLESLNQKTGPIIAAAIKVHRQLGPGLLESVYTKCLAFELRRSGIAVVTERMLPVRYEGMQLDCGFRLDIVAMNEIVLEIKSVRKLAPIHDAQLLTYLRLTGYPVGLLPNFNVPLLKHGIKRVLNPRSDGLVDRDGATLEEPD